MANEGETHRHAVLVVADDHDTREAFLMLAESVGLDAVGVENGRAALRVLREASSPA
jgi:CheY-like chemotaxis protein